MGGRWYVASAGRGRLTSGRAEDGPMRDYAWEVMSINCARAAILSVALLGYLMLIEVASYVIARRFGPALRISSGRW